MTNPWENEEMTKQPAFTDEESRWNVLVNRDRATEGAFYYAVQTTGVFCRPECSSRLPKRENVEFFDSSKQAERAGYRPCKRCKPDAASPRERQTEPELYFARSNVSPFASAGSGYASWLAPRRTMSVTGLWCTNKSAKWIQAWALCPGFVHVVERPSVAMPANPRTPASERKRKEVTARSMDNPIDHHLREAIMDSVDYRRIDRATADVLFGSQRRRGPAMTDPSGFRACLKSLNLPQKW
jgi:hypothetical protein